METKIAFQKGEKSYNKWHEEVVNCRLCHELTTMIGTELCDTCWEVEMRVLNNIALTITILQNAGYIVGRKV